jgi:hypothetical protein
MRSTRTVEILLPGSLAPVLTHYACEMACRSLTAPVDLERRNGMGAASWTWDTYKLSLTPYQMLTSQSATGYMYKLR